MFSLDFSDVDTRKFAPSRRELAKILGCSEAKISVMLVEPGNPGRNSNGSYPIEAWKNFFAEREKRKSAKRDETATAISLSGASADERAELRSAVLRERRAKAEKAELEAARMRGELVPLAEAEQAAQEFAAKLRAKHHRASTVEAVNEISARLMLSSAQTSLLLAYMEKFHERFCTEVSADVAGEN